MERVVLIPDPVTTGDTTCDSRSDLRTSQRHARMTA